MLLPLPASPASATPLGVDPEQSVAPDGTASFSSVLALALVPLPTPLTGEETESGTLSPSVAVSGASGEGSAQITLDEESLDGAAKQEGAPLTVSFLPAVSQTPEGAQPRTEGSAPTPAEGNALPDSDAPVLSTHPARTEGNESSLPQPPTLEPVSTRPAGQAPSVTPPDVPRPTPSSEPGSPDGSATVSPSAPQASTDGTSLAGRSVSADASAAPADPLATSPSASPIPQPVEAQGVSETRGAAPLPSAVNGEAAAPTTSPSDVEGDVQLAGPSAEAPHADSKTKAPSSQLAAPARDAAPAVAQTAPPSNTASMEADAPAAAPQKASPSPSNVTPRPLEQAIQPPPSLPGSEQAQVVSSTGTPIQQKVDRPQAGLTSEAHAAELIELASQPSGTERAVRRAERAGQPSAPPSPRAATPNAATPTTSPSAPTVAAPATTEPPAPLTAQPIPAPTTAPDTATPTTPEAATTASQAVETDEPARTTVREPGAPSVSERASEGRAVANGGSQDAASGDSRRQGSDTSDTHRPLQPASASSPSDSAEPLPSTTEEPGVPEVLSEADTTPGAEEVDAAPETAPTRATSTSGTASTLRSESATLPRPILSAAWLQKLGEAAPHAAAGTWQSVQLSLGEGDGELTVQAQRDEERVRVAIGFSDPHLRLLATEQADRIQSALEARYGTDVDLSFTDGEREQPGERGEPGGLPQHPTSRRATAADAPTPATTSARSHPGTHNEWVG